MDGDLSVIIEALIAFILAIIAWYQNRTAKSNLEIQKTNATMAMIEVQKPTYNERLEMTRKWILVGESEEDKKKINDQIDQARDAGLKDFQIVYSRGGYTIENNLIKSSWRS